MELQAGVGRFPRRFGGQHLGHIRFGAARLVRIEQRAGFKAHQIRRFDVDVRARNRKLHALVLADGSPEHDALVDVLADLVDEPVAVADAFGGDQRALGVQAIEDVLEALAFFADQILGRDFEVLEEQLIGLVVDHVLDRLHDHALLDGVLDVDQEDRHALGFFRDLGKGRGARQQDHQVGMLHARDPHLLPVDHIAVALAHGRRLDFGGVGAGGGLGHGHRLQAQFAAGDARQVMALLRFGAVAQQRAHIVHLAMAGAGVAARAVDLFHDHRGFRQAQTRAAIFLRDQRSEPAGLRQCGHEGFGVAPLVVDLAEVLGREFGAQGAQRIADVFKIVVVVHGGLLVLIGVAQASSASARMASWPSWVLAHRVIVWPSGSTRPQTLKR